MDYAHLRSRFAHILAFQDCEIRISWKELQTRPWPHAKPGRKDDPCSHGSCLQINKHWRAPADGLFWNVVSKFNGLTPVAGKHASRRKPADRAAHWSCRKMASGTMPSSSPTGPHKTLGVANGRPAPVARDCCRSIARSMTRFPS